MTAGRQAPVVCWGSGLELRWPSRGLPRQRLATLPAKGGIPQRFGAAVGAVHVSRAEEEAPSSLMIFVQTASTSPFPPTGHLPTPARHVPHDRHERPLVQAPKTSCQGASPGARNYRAPNWLPQVRQNRWSGPPAVPHLVQYLKSDDPAGGAPGDDTDGVAVAPAARLRLRPPLASCKSSFASATDSSSSVARSSSSRLFLFDALRTSVIDPSSRL